MQETTPLITKAALTLASGVWFDVYDKKYIKKGIKFNNIVDIEETYPNHIPKQVANIKEYAKDISTEDLGEYLRKYYQTETYQKNKSLFRKLIALYDFKKYS